MDTTIRTSEKVPYRYLFRLDTGETVMVRHETRPGDADGCARKLARMIGKKERSASVVCVWRGPEWEKIPEEIRREIRESAV